MRSDRKIYFGSDRLGGMIAQNLKTTDPSITLVEPDLKRDPALGVKWLQGNLGFHTLSLMGVPDKDNKPTTLEAETERVRGFIEGKNQLNWMIQYQRKIVGLVWVDLSPWEGLPAPSVHIMIGDPEMRGKGVGTASMRSVLDYLENQGHATIYSRHLTFNDTVKKMLFSLGFEDAGIPHSDADGLEWQDLVWRQKRSSGTN